MEWKSRAHGVGGGMVFPCAPFLSRCERGNSDGVDKEEEEKVKILLTVELHVWLFIPEVNACFILPLKPLWTSYHISSQHSPDDFI